MTCLAAIQTNSSDDIDHNLQIADEYIDEARQKGAEVIVLPECFGFMQKNRDQLFQCAESEETGKIQKFLAHTAQKQNVWIIGGSVPLKSSDPKKITNSLLAYDNQGIRVARYDKIFLFNVTLNNGEMYNESEYTLAGNSLDVVDSPVGKIGLSICYDLRFPEIYRKLTQMGAQILIVPSAFSSTTGQSHWLPLLQARAIENNCYVVAPAQTGIHSSGRKTWGHTVIIDPWGEILVERAADCGVVLADIDLIKLKRIREQLPSLQHCRPDILP